jgi:hypothetical protein
MKLSGEPDPDRRFHLMSHISILGIIRGEGAVARMGQMRNIYEHLDTKPDGTEPVFVAVGWGER